MERSCSTDKSLQKHNTFIFFYFFEKLLGFYKLLKSGGSRSFSVKENTRIKCICYINNMFSKKFINQTLKSYTSFDFIYTYSRYRFEIIKLWLYLPPKNYQISFKTTVTLYFNIEESNLLVKDLYLYSRIILIIHFRSSHWKSSTCIELLIKMQLVFWKFLKFPARNWIKS